MPQPKITRCRGCQGKSLTSVIDLGTIAVSNFLRHPEKRPWCEQLELTLCSDCGLLQSAYPAPEKDRLYQTYWYRSAVNSMMRSALRSITRSVENMHLLRPDDIVLDIGANDGTLLRSYTSRDIRRVGFEPAENLLSDARAGTDIIINDYFGTIGYQTEVKEPAKVITSVAMFYDVDDPHSFIRDIAAILAPDGVWINQMAYLPDMLRNSGFDHICHEHIGYYSLQTFEQFLVRHGLVLIDVSHNNVNGGSFKTTVAHANNASITTTQQKRIARWKKQEILLGLDSPATYRKFMHRVDTICKAMSLYIRGEVKRGKRIYAYGASTKGNTLLQYLRLTTKQIPKAVERNPQKCGLYTAGTNIPIISETQGRNERPDIFFVLPWHFKNEIVNREGLFLRRGGSLLFPSPTPQIISLRRGRLTTTKLRS